jgi:hypothetical protein
VGRRFAKADFFFFREHSFASCRISHPQFSGADSFARSYQRAGSNHPALLHINIIQQACFHPDEGAVFDRTGVQEHHVSHCYVISQVSALISMGNMNNSTILDIGTFSNTYIIDISAQDASKPNSGLGANFYISDYDRITGNKRICRNTGQDALKRKNPRIRLGSHFVLGRVLLRLFFSIDVCFNGYNTKSQALSNHPLHIGGNDRIKNIPSQHSTGYWNRSHALLAIADSTLLGPK